MDKKIEMRLPKIQKNMSLSIAARENANYINALSSVFTTPILESILKGAAEISEKNQADSIAALPLGSEFWLLQFSATNGDMVYFPFPCTKKECKGVCHYTVSQYLKYGEKYYCDSCSLSKN